MVACARDQGFLPPAFRAFTGEILRPHSSIQVQ